MTRCPCCQSPRTAEEAATVRRAVSGFLTVAQIGQIERSFDVDGPVDALCYEDLVAAMAAAV